MELLRSNVRVVLEAVLQADLATAREQSRFWLVDASRTLALHSGQTTEFIVFSLVLQPLAGQVLSSWKPSK